MVCNTLSHGNKVQNQIIAHLWKKQVANRRRLCLFEKELLIDSVPIEVTRICLNNWHATGEMLSERKVRCDTVAYDGQSSNTGDMLETGEM